MVNCKHDQRIAGRPTAGIEALPHYHQLLVERQNPEIPGILRFYFLFPRLLNQVIYVRPHISRSTTTTSTPSSD